MRHLRNPANVGVLVAALGYFVDVYDLILFSVIRIASLRGIGVPEEEILSTGVLLLNMQMIGMLVGGVLWGIWGDKRGRLSVLFGSILMYSVANVLNGMVMEVWQYAVLRFVAGIGLAGELGAGITLVSETLDKETRGYGTTFVATVGVAGAVAAALVGESFDWRVSYYIGGAMGFALLLLRVAVHESGMFTSLTKKAVHRGSLGMLFTSRERLIRYFSCIFVGLPIWFAVGILVTFAPEFGKAMNSTEPLSAGTAVLYCYIGLVFGDLASGLLSQWSRSRRRIIALFLCISAIFCSLYLLQEAPTAALMYALAGGMGFGVGYWALFVTSAAEQFGTNLRATVTTTVPNFVRGSVVPVTLLFHALREDLGIVASAAVCGAACYLIAFVSLAYLEESFGRDLDFLEK